MIWRKRSGLECSCFRFLASFPVRLPVTVTARPTPKVDGDRRLTEEPYLIQWRCLGSGWDPRLLDTSFPTAPFAPTRDTPTMEHSAPPSKPGTCAKAQRIAEIIAVPTAPVKAYSPQEGLQRSTFTSSFSVQSTPEKTVFLRALFEHPQSRIFIYARQIVIAARFHQRGQQQPLPEERGDCNVIRRILIRRSITEECFAKSVDRY